MPFTMIYYTLIIILFQRAPSIVIMRFFGPMLKSIEFIASPFDGCAYWITVLVTHFLFLNTSTNVLMHNAVELIRWLEKFDILGSLFFFNKWNHAVL